MFYKSGKSAAIAGYGKNELSAPFETAGPLTEALLIANLAIRGYNLQVSKADGKAGFPGRYIKYLWDNENMKVTNFDPVNQFVQRQYRNGWKLKL
jgi:hypothetical protein